MIFKTHPSSWLKTRAETSEYWAGVQSHWTLNHSWWEHTRVQPPSEAVWPFPTMLETHTRRQPAAPPRYLPK